MLPALQVTADSKFVDLGADSLDTVRRPPTPVLSLPSAQRAERPRAAPACSVQCGDPRCARSGGRATRGRPLRRGLLLDQVEIMMALEEQFSITLDEEGAPPARCRPCGVIAGPAPNIHFIFVLLTLRFLLRRRRGEDRHRAGGG